MRVCPGNVFETLFWASIGNMLHLGYIICNYQLNLLIFKVNDIALDLNIYYGSIFSVLGIFFKVISILTKRISSK
jgi:hypothetical protein